VASRQSSERLSKNSFKELKRGDCVALKRYINAGGNVNAREADSPHITLLHAAGVLKLSRASSLLVEAGADVNATADDGITPLVSAQSSDIARLLLDSGANAELTDLQGRNALRLACERDSVELAKLFLKRTTATSIQQAALDGFTPLSAAAIRMQEALALLVLAAHPADYDGNEALRAPRKHTTLYTAACFGFVKLAEALLKRGADVNRGSIGEHDRTPYMYAAQEGRLAMLDLLQQYGADVNAVATDGCTALTTASSCGQALAIKVLVRHGADVNIHTGARDRAPPLMSAVVCGHIGAARALLEAGLHPGCSAEFQMDTALSKLEDSAAVEILRLLLQHLQLDVKAVRSEDLSYGTLIFAAAALNKLKAAQLLVSAGADLHTKAADGETVLHFAAQYDAVRTLRWFVATHKLNPCEATAGGSLPLHYACYMGSTAAAEYLLSLPQAVAMLTSQDSEGYTALHVAAENEHDDIVKLLLRKGAVVDARSQTGVTPLMRAQRMRTVNLLLNAHADVNAVDGDSFTVLHHCAKQGAAECVYKPLLKHGAVPTAVDKNGSTPAHIAGMSGHFADEALLSRAADDYRKTHAAVSSDAAETAVSSSKKQQCDVASGISGTTNSSSSSSGQQASSSADNNVIDRSSSAETAAAATAASSEAVESSVKQRKQKVKQPCAIVNCKKLTTKLCRRCAVVYYCSTECQKVCFKDAKHRAKCEEVASAIIV
jgi:ankyrin repeat protein